jgi:UDP-N-acetylmuramoylalanine--D-glutamate ligase
MISSKRIAILGFGKEGLSSANYLGQKNKITIFDQKSQDQIDKEFFKNLKIKDVNFYFGGTFPADPKFDCVLRSPGVKTDNPQVKKLVANGASLTSATKIFFNQCPAKIIGVTGTKGKGTTATLIFEMLKTQNAQVFLAGNIGTPVLDILPKLTLKSLVVLELSSFQLFDLKKSPHIAVILMITSEHLDWHKNQSEYQKAKQSIVAFQTKNDFAVINHDYEISRSFAQKTKAKVYFVSTREKVNGLYLKGTKIISKIDGRQIIYQTSRILLPGRHNLENVLASVATAKILGIANQNIIKTLSTFKGLPYRLELVREVSGIKFYNDSFSTIPETSIAAIEAFASSKVLILGGSSKRSDFSKLGRKIHQDQSIKAIILIGQEAARIKKAISKAGGTSAEILQGLKNMEEIVNRAYQLADLGDIVLLSPACASFDIFKNYQDRGEQFSHQVLELKAK